MEAVKKYMVNGNEYDWKTIVHYMDEDTRERVHSELAPCTEEEFLARYLELDPKFSIN